MATCVSPSHSGESLPKPPQGSMEHKANGESLATAVQKVIDDIVGALLHTGADEFGISQRTDEGGYIPVMFFAELPPVTAITQDRSVVLRALRESTLVSMDKYQTVVSFNRPPPSVDQIPVPFQTLSSSPPHYFVQHPYYLPEQHVPQQGIQMVPVDSMPMFYSSHQMMLAPGSSAIPGYAGAVPIQGVGLSTSAPAGSQHPRYWKAPHGAHKSAERGHGGRGGGGRNQDKRGSFKGNGHRSRTVSTSSDNGQYGAEAAFEDDLTTAMWLKIIRLHKYTEVLENVTREDLLRMPDEELEKYPITDGARRKLRIEIARWANHKGYDVPFEIPKSRSESYQGSRSGSQSGSRPGSRPGSRGGSFSGGRDDNVKGVGRSSSGSRPSSRPGSRGSSFSGNREDYLKSRVQANHSIADKTASPEQLMNAVNKAAAEMKIREDGDPSTLTEVLTETQ
eukprot:m.367162 g.367162  ORF g.367162 m.367162 type:complete len:451 (-) comp20824_c0_seq3:1145-2497(-)